MTHAVLDVLETAQQKIKRKHLHDGRNYGCGSEVPLVQPCKTGTHGVKPGRQPIPVDQQVGEAIPFRVAIRRPS